MAVVGVDAPCWRDLPPSAQQPAIGIALIFGTAWAEAGESAGKSPWEADQTICVASVFGIDTGYSATRPSEYSSVPLRVDTEGQVEHFAGLTGEVGVIEVKRGGSDRIGTCADHRRGGCELLRAAGSDEAQLDIGSKTSRGDERPEQVRASSLERHLQIILRCEIVRLGFGQEWGDGPPGREPRILDKTKSGAG